MIAHNIFMSAFIIAVAVIVYEDVHTCHRLPWPPRLIFTGLFFALTSLLSLLNEELAAVVALGAVLAILVNKGFVGDCNIVNASFTVQPASETAFLVSPTPTNQSTSGSGAGT